MATFTEQEIRNGLQRLGELAHMRNIHIRLTAVGGVVMVLAFGTRQSTKDVDAVIVAPSEARVVRALAEKVAEDMTGPLIGLTTGRKAICAESATDLLFSALQALKFLRLHLNNCLP